MPMNISRAIGPTLATFEFVQKSGLIVRMRAIVSPRRWCFNGRGHNRTKNTLDRNLAALDFIGPCQIDLSHYRIVVRLDDASLDDEIQRRFDAVVQVGLPSRFPEF